MRQSPFIAVSFAVLSVSPAIAQTQDRAPVALPSASRLSQDETGKESWTYINPNARFSSYRSVIVDPTVVYTGADAQFQNVPVGERPRLAQIFTNTLSSELARSFPNPGKARADTVRVRVTLIGVRTTKGGVATATRVTPLGFGLSAAKSLMGKGGSFTGSVLYAVEVYDGRSGNLLLAAVRRRTPDALDIPATLSTTDTVKAVARDFSKSARERLESMTGVAAPR